MEPTLQERVDEASHKEGTPLYLPPPLNSARSSHGRASIENHHGKYDRKEDVRKDRDGHEVRDKRKKIPMKLYTSSDDDGNASDDKPRRTKSEKKERSRNDRAEDTSSDDSSVSDSETFDDEKKRSRPEGGAEIGQDVLIWRSALQVSLSPTTNKTKRATADTPPIPVLRKKV